MCLVTLWGSLPVPGPRHMPVQWADLEPGGPPRTIAPSPPGSGTSYENVAGQGVTARGSLRKPGQESRSRASYGTPQVSLLGASSTGWSNDKLALPVERSPLEKDRHHRRPIATVSASTAITYPTPDVPAGQPLRKSG